VDAGTTLVELAHVRLHKHGEDAPRSSLRSTGPALGKPWNAFSKVL
jgi:hypothetical protein